mmetsp:Transcript_74671/g.112514  ORF Transcript_74671/g.112514 Transcript_74671/m.112514 type:complete len:208 (-) Transcript_74671:296-919(-)
MLALFPALSAPMTPTDCSQSACSCVRRARLRNVGDPSGHAPFVLSVSGKKALEVGLLVGDALVEETPGGCREEHEGDRIREQNLGGGGPPEPAEVARMARDGVESVRDQLVLLPLLPVRNLVSEVVTGLDQCPFPENLSKHHPRQPQPSRRCPSLHPGKESLGDKIFEAGDSHGTDILRLHQERIGGEHVRVVVRNEKVLSKVVETQ